MTAQFPVGLPAGRTLPLTDCFWFWHWQHVSISEKKKLPSTFIFFMKWRKCHLIMSKCTHTQKNTVILHFMSLAFQIVHITGSIYNTYSHFTVCNMQSKAYLCILVFSAHAHQCFSNIVKTTPAKTFFNRLTLESFVALCADWHIPCSGPNSSISG